MSWPKVRLGELGKMIRGSGIRRNETVPEGLPCIRYGEIYTSYNVVLDRPRSFVPPSLYEKCPHIKKGDLVLALTGENKEEIAKSLAYLGDDEVAAGGDTAVWTGHGCDPLYLAYMMYSPRMIKAKADASNGHIVVHASVKRLQQIEVSLPPLATGTGKTFIAYQLCRKLVLARWSNTKPLGSREPTILFITDRNILADQALGDFYFQDHACFRYLAGTEKVPMDRLVYFTLFQTLLGEDGRDTKYKKFKPDFFDLVIIDECHRGGRNDESQWRKILDYFSGACHVGLTATPQCDVNGNTYEYFGKPAYEYSLRRGIADGFLTQYRVDKLKSTLSAYKVEDGDIINCPEEIDRKRSEERAFMEGRRAAQKAWATAHPDLEGAL